TRAARMSAAGGGRGLPRPAPSSATPKSLCWVRPPRQRRRGLPRGARPGGRGGPPARPPRPPPPPAAPRPRPRAPPAPSRCRPPKDRMKLVATSAGVDTPRFVLAGDDADVARAARSLKFPLFVKPRAAGDSLGIEADSLARTPAQLRAAARRVIASF